MKTYGEIDLDESPIVVLGCGHFFTAETLDGHMGISEVYEQDQNGAFTGLRDTSNSLAKGVPRCPDCQCPVRQFCAQRYNRVINRAVIDEMSKRFLVNGKEKLRELEQDIVKLEHKFGNFQGLSFEVIHHSLDQVTRAITEGNVAAKEMEITKELEKRFLESEKLETTIRKFRISIADKNQPAQKLHDAMVSVMRRRPIDEIMTDLDINGTVPKFSPDRRVTLGSWLAQVQAKCIILTDRFTVALLLKSTPAGTSIRIPGGSPETKAKLFFDDCGALVHECIKENFSKMGVEAILYYARLARSNESYCRSTNMEVTSSSKYVKAAKDFLEIAKKTCEKSFQNAEQLRGVVDKAIKMIGKQWYEEVTPEEIAAIKKAMVTGSRGLATHSGHWYNCANGHPVRLCPV